VALFETPAATVASAATQFALLRGRSKRTYYPSAVLRLFVRLEDWTNADGASAQTEAAPPPSRAQQLRAQAQARRASAASARALGSLSLTDAARARAASAADAAPPTGADQAPPNDVPRDDQSIEVAVVPLDLEVELNSFRIADKLTASFALADLPIVPELVRSVLVEAYFGTSRAEDFGTPARWIPSLLQTQAPMFRGYADVFETDAGEDFRVVIQARSLEARLMDKKVHPLTKERRVQRNDSFLDPQTHQVVRGEKITGFVRRFLGTVPEFSGALGDRIGVRLFPNVDDAQEPVLSAAMFLRTLQTASSRAAAGGQVQAAPPDPSGTDPASQVPQGQPVVPAPAAATEFSVWDVLVRACELVGLLPLYDPSVLVQDASGQLVRGADNILLVPPQTLKETPEGGISIAGGPTDGFSRRIQVGGVGDPIRTEVRFLVWGENLKRLHFTRKYGRIKAPAVRVVCYDPDGAAGRRVLSAQFPATPRGTSVSASGSGPRQHQPVEEVVTKVVAGIRDVGVLKQIAVALYHQLSRYEVSADIETDEMASYIDPTRPESHNENPDLLRLRPGTPVRVMVARRVVDPAAGDRAYDTLSQLFDRRANPAFLRKALLGGSGGAVFLGDAGRAKVEEALSRVEAAYQSARLTDWFYVRAVRHRWGADEGYSCAMEVANFVEARNLPQNLSAQDAADNDLRKKRKTAAPSVPDPRRAAAQANFARLVGRGTGG
jgi:hypothetical protein